MQRTIFITSFFGLSARNILSTSILDILGKDQNNRIVILAPQEKKENYQQYFLGNKKNVIVEGLNLKNTRMKTFAWTSESASRLERFFFSLFLNSSDTKTRRVYRIAERFGAGYPLQAFFHWILAKLGNFKIFRRALRYLDFKILPKNRYAAYFEKYQPDLVFATDIFNEHDVQVMRGARARRIKIVAMVRSWDNITSHGLNRIIPDKLIVNTPKVKEEAIRYNDIPAENIFISGIPHYDKYIARLRTSRADLFRKLNLDPNKKTIFFAPPSDLYTEHNPVSLQAVKELRNLDDSQLILRLYMVGGINLGDTRPIPGKIAIDAPPQHINFMTADLAPKDDAHLADLLYHSDVVVAVASTLAIDAATLGKPVVFIGFDGDQRPYWKSLRRYYDFDHQRYLLNTGGVKLADNMGELVKYVKDYLNNPSLDMENRKNINEEFCWKLDEKSGERVGNFLMSQLKNV